MMTLRENAMAIYNGEKPDFYGDIMDAVELIPDPVLMGTCRHRMALSTRIRGERCMFLNQASGTASQGK